MGLVVLGLAEPAERDLVRDHCATCVDCATTLTELTPLPDLLGTVDREHAEAGLPEPSPELFRRIVQETQTERDQLATRQRRRRVLMTGAGLAAASVAVLGVLVLQGGGPTSDPEVLVASATDGNSHVQGSFTVEGVQSGSEITLALRGVAPGERCRLIARGPGGTQEVAGWWVAEYDGRATVTGHTSLTPDDITDLVVVTQSGEKLLEVPASSLVVDD
jgi:hypothetical protein